MYVCRYVVLYSRYSAKSCICEYSDKLFISINAILSADKTSAAQPPHDIESMELKYFISILTYT